MLLFNFLPNLEYKRCPEPTSAAADLVPSECGRAGDKNCLAAWPIGSRGSYALFFYSAAPSHGIKQTHSGLEETKIESHKQKFYFSLVIAQNIKKINRESQPISNRGKITMEALAKLKSFGLSSSSDKLRKVRSESPNSGSWLRRLRIGKSGSSGRKSLPNTNQIGAVIHANERHMQEPYLNINDCAFRYENRSAHDSMLKVGNHS